MQTGRTPFFLSQSGGRPLRLRTSLPTALHNIGLWRPCGTCSCCVDATQDFRPGLTYAAPSGLEYDASLRGWSVGTIAMGPLAATTNINFNVNGSGRGRPLFTRGLNGHKQLRLRRDGRMRPSLQGHTCISCWAEEVPGFAVGVVEAGAAVAAAAEQEAGDSASGVQRNDVPSVFGDDVDGEEVDFAGEVRDGASASAAVGVDAVEAFEELGGTLYLDAPEGR